MADSQDNGSFDLDTFLATLTTRPGVYRMLDADGGTLYVGKAKNLRRRVTGYFRRGATDTKTMAMVAQVASVAVTVTHTDADALILENHLIKAERPRYNVLLRDDKSYPYIHLSGNGDYPRLAFHRGARKAPGEFFGPFPSAGAVRDALGQLQKLFRVRQCEESVFRNRTRPCLQYQIKRCSAPCVGWITPEAYATDVAHTRLFLSGRGEQVIDALAARMEAAATRLDYEEAARLRDRIGALRRVQARRSVSGRERDLDAVACVVSGGLACVQVLMVRGGHHLGSRAHFPTLPGPAEPADVGAAFLAQHYLDAAVPPLLLVESLPDEHEVLEAALAAQAGRRVTLRVPRRGEIRRWIEMARDDAVAALAGRVANRAGVAQRLEALGEALSLDATPERIECFDISHTQGGETVASCVVFDSTGPVKSDYRRFNIRDAAPGDDYAAIREAVGRRFRRLAEGEGKWPDLLLIDGGRGQLDAACGALDELLVDGLAVVGVSKGEGRRPGLESLHLVGHQAPMRLAAADPALHLVQQVRDEAHRFAITGHRQRRAKAQGGSTLEEIPGLGPKRRRELLRRFGGLREVARAGIDDLARTPGISHALAQRIYDRFHGAS